MSDDRDYLLAALAQSSVQEAFRASQRMITAVLNDDTPAARDVAREYIRAAILPGQDSGTVLAVALTAWSVSLIKDLAAITGGDPAAVWERTAVSADSVIEGIADTD